MSAPLPAPRVSVLMTLYNKGAFVEEAIQSVLGQTYTDFELLVVDDASTDGGLEVARRFDDPRIRILESAVNTGRPSAANRGYDAARGDHVAVLDADDVMHPERLAKQVAFMDANPDIAISGSAYRTTGENAKQYKWPATDRECRAGLLFGDPLIYGTSMIRRSVLEAHHLRCNERWLLPGMDYLFILQFSRHGRYANLQEALTNYRMGANNMRHGRDEFADRLALRRETFRFFGLEASDAELDLHMALHGLWRKPFDAKAARALHRWTGKLIQQNREKQLFPADLFEAEVHHRWSRLFHAFADAGLGAAVAHLRLGGSWPMDRLGYLAKTTIRRWSGRAR